MIHIPANIVAQIFSHAATVKLALAKEFGLNPLQFLALVLVGNEDGLSTKKLRHKLSVPGSSLTFTVDSLEKKQLIKRQRSESDRRQWLLSLSDSGDLLYQQIVEAEHKAISPALDNLSEVEKAAFLRIAEEITKERGNRIWAE